MLLKGSVEKSPSKEENTPRNAEILTKDAKVDPKTPVKAEEVAKKDEILKESSAVGRNDRTHSKQSQTKFRHVPKDHWRKLSG